MAELIQRTDSLNTGREKLNEAIKASDRAEDKADYAVDTANQALNKSESTQTQLDTIVIDGDSSVEAAQARVDEKGIVHPTLKARIDDGMNSVNSQLAQAENSINEIDSKIKNTIVHVDDFPRISPENTDDGRIQRALNTIQRGKVIFSRKTYEISTSLEIDHDRLELVGVGLGTILKTDNDIPIIKSISSERNNYKDRSISNLTIKGIYFQGENKRGIGILGTGLARNTKFTNCFFRDLNYAVAIDGSWSFSLQNCFATQCNNGFHLATGLAGTYLDTTEVNAVSIDKCYLTDIKNNGDGVAISIKDKGYNVTITNSTVEQNDAGVFIGDIRVISITNNYIEHNEKYGLQLGNDTLSTSNWIVKENHFNFTSFKPVNCRYGHYEDNFNPGGTFEVIQDQSKINNNNFQLSFREDITDGTSEQGLGILDSLNNNVSFKYFMTPRKLTLQNGWVNHDEVSRGGLRVYTTNDGMAHVEGAIKDGAIGLSNPVTVLPLGFRPHYLTYFSCIDESGKAIPVSIQSDGRVVVRQSTSTILYISCQYKSNPFSTVLA